MYTPELTQISDITITDIKPHKVREIDFKPLHIAEDPAIVLGIAFAARAPTPTPTEITPDTLLPAYIGAARRYPDAAQWANGHNSELDQLDPLKAIDWLEATSIPADVKPLSLTITYKYKRAAYCNVIDRKACWSIRGEILQKVVHFDPDKTTAFTEDKAGSHILFSTEAAHGQPMRHLEIKSAFTSEKFSHDRPVYVHQMKQFDGTYCYPSGRIGKLLLNL